MCLLRLPELNSPPYTTRGREELCCSPGQKTLHPVSLCPIALVPSYPLMPIN